VGQVLPDAQPVQMMPRELQGAHPVGQVADLQLVGQGEERDAGGQRVLTTWPDDDGTVIYTPFPDFEREVAGGGGVTERTSYTLAGQLIAVRVKVSGGSNELYYTYTDHLGSVAAMSYSGGTYRANSLARYDPFGNHRTLPGWSINPGISDRGFTGHVHDNTGPYPTQNVGLIYMNARYYLPEIGRFISADTIVPEPGNPQGFNRYAYALNSPVNFTDPSGHCINNYDLGSQDMETCVAAWNAVVNYVDGVFYQSGSYGDYPNEGILEWLMNADIVTLEKLMEEWGISYGYTWSPPQGYFVSGWRGGNDLKSPEARATGCDYWQSCYYPATDYATAFVSYFVGVKLIQDNFGNWYFNLHFSAMPGAGLVIGDLNVPAPDGTYRDVSDLAVDQRELVVQESLQGWGGGASASIVLGGGIASNPHNDLFYEGGWSFPGVTSEFGYTWLIFDK